MAYRELIDSLTDEQKYEILSDLFVCLENERLIDSSSGWEVDDDGYLSVVGYSDGWQPTPIAPIWHSLEATGIFPRRAAWEDEWEYEMTVGDNLDSLDDEPVTHDFAVFNKDGAKFSITAEEFEAGDTGFDFYSGDELVAHVPFGYIIKRVCA